MKRYLWLFGCLLVNCTSISLMINFLLSDLIIFWLLNGNIFLLHRLHTLLAFLPDLVQFLYPNDKILLIKISWACSGRFSDIGVCKIVHSMSSPGDVVVGILLLSKLLTCRSVKLVDVYNFIAPSWSPWNRSGIQLVHIQDCILFLARGSKVSLITIERVHFINLFFQI